MGIRDRFAEQYAKQKTMTGPEKKANDIIGKLMMKKAVLPIVAMVVLVAISIFVNIPWWALLGLEILAAVGSFFYLKNEGKKYQEFTPYVGNLINVEKKGKDGHTVLIKQGKKPIKLELKYGGEDLEKLKKNTLVQITYNPVGKIGIVVTRNNLK